MARTTPPVTPPAADRKPGTSANAGLAAFLEGAGISTASIGPVTSKTMREHGLKVDVEAKQYDIPGLIAAIQKYYGA